MGRAELLAGVGLEEMGFELISAAVVLCDLGQVLHLFVPSFPLV